jgi:hypothetical protein
MRNSKIGYANHRTSNTEYNDAGGDDNNGGLIVFRNPDVYDDNGGDDNDNNEDEDSDKDNDNDDDDNDDEDEDDDGNRNDEDMGDPQSQGICLSLERIFKLNYSLSSDSTS